MLHLDEHPTLKLPTHVLRRLLELPERSRLYVLPFGEQISAFVLMFCQRPTKDSLTLFEGSQFLDLALQSDKFFSIDAGALQVPQDRLVLRLHLIAPCIPPLLDFSQVPVECC